MHVRYRLLDQKRFNFVTIKDLKSGQHLTMHAVELASNDEMIEQFPSWDACRIGIIAGCACNDRPINKNGIKTT